MSLRAFSASVLAATVMAPASQFASAQALSPAEVFRKVSPSVWVVRPLDAAERPIGTGSGVVIGPGLMVTNCHVLAKARGIQVRRNNVSYDAKLQHADTERDLCILTIADFNAPAPVIRPLSEVSVGERVYTVGNPAGLSQTIAEGLLSGLRPEDASLPPIQTSAPISPGSSGGGLFDEQGRLIGITTLIVNNRARLAQNLNFAVPADWIAEVPARGKAALEARRDRPGTGATPGATPAAQAAPGLPAAGATYRYQWADRKFGKRAEFTIKVANASGTLVSELLSTESATDMRADLDSSKSAFHSRMLSSSQALLEFAPYFRTTQGEELPASPLGSMHGYPTGGYDAWTLSIPSMAWEPVSVPAGSYRALRLELRGTRRTGGNPSFRATVEERFEYLIWYVPELRRYVRFQHRTWGAYGDALADEVAELVEAKGN